jgi:hypothetical protein
VQRYEEKRRKVHNSSKEPGLQLAGLLQPAAVVEVNALV